MARIGGAAASARNKMAGGEAAAAVQHMAARNIALIAYSANIFRALRATILRHSRGGET